MKKKKLLFIVEAMGGGVFTYIVDLANELSLHYEMYVAYGLRNQTPRNYKDYFNKNVHLIKVENFTREINLKKDIKAFLEIKRIAKNIQPDIIHLHSSKSGVLGRFAFNGKKVPLYYTPHGYSFLMQSYNEKKRKAFKFIESICAKRNCTTISCSKGEHLETLKLTRKAKYVNNGINVKKLQNLLDSIPKEKNKEKTVFTLGRISYQKNPELFNEIAKKLPNIRFIWIGDGELRDKLEAGNITITGWLDRASALKTAMNADVFILTSLWEGLPISLLEAMYMKKMCVVSDVIGNHDVISNKSNGYVCKTVDQFVNAINEYPNDYAIENAYKDILEVYNTKVMAKKYIDIYEHKGDLYD